MYGFNLYTSYRSVLDEQTYADLHLGDPRSAVTSHLPPYEYDDKSRPPGTPADPAHTDECVFYRQAAFDNSRLYRLCFTDSHLTHKGLVSTEAHTKGGDAAHS